VNLVIFILLVRQRTHTHTQLSVMSGEKSYIFQFKGRQPIFKHVFTPALNAGAGARVAILNFSTYFTGQNINSECDSFGLGGKVYKLEHGNYSARQLCEHVKQVSGDRAELTALLPCNKMQLTSKEQVDFSVKNSIAPILGFRRAIYAAGVKHTAETTVNLHQHEHLLVSCLGANGSFRNNRRTQCILQVPLVVPPNFKITAHNTRPHYYSLNAEHLSELSFHVGGDLPGAAGGFLLDNWGSDFSMEVNLIVHNAKSD